MLVLRKEIIYEYLADQTTLIQRKHLQLQALRNGINSYTDRYRWTGSGRSILKMLTSNFEIINQRKQGDPEWDYFDISVPHHLNKGQIVEFTIEWELADEKRTGLPFLASTIDVETKYLLLQVILPPELAPTRAYAYEFANYIDTLPT